MFTPNLVVGIGIMLLGMVLMLDILGLAEARDLVRYWPVLLVLFGASVMAQALRGGSEPAVGRSQRPIVNPGLVIVLVLIGLFVSRALERRPEPDAADASNRIRVFAVMGEDQRIGGDAGFRRAEVTTVMGKSQLDLRQAALAPGEEGVVDVFGMMGQVVVYVPSHWTVDLQAASMMGGIRDQRLTPERPRRRSRRTPVPEETGAPALQAEQPLPDDPDASAPTASGPPPRLVIRGFIMMGGLVVRSIESRVAEEREQ